jgi:tRNA(Ile)-lysidine synthase
MLQKLTDFIEKNSLFSKTDSLLLAVSGGIDSVVLCHMLHQLGYTFAIAHCNFKLRKEESDLDEDFVKKMSIIYDAPFYHTSFNTTAYASENKISIQMAARELRYSWFNSLKTEKPFKLLTAHHLNDSIETSLLNYIRGAGIKGVKGIELKNEFRISPLLCFTKNELIKYAENNKLEWREDISNASINYERNFIRHKIIPLFTKINGSYLQTIPHGLEKIGIVEKYYNDLLKDSLKNDIILKGELTFVIFENWDKNSVLPKLLFLLESLNFRFSEIKKLAENLFILQSGKIIRSITHELCIDRGKFIIRKIKKRDKTNIIVKDLETLLKGIKTDKFELKAKVLNSLDFDLKTTPKNELLIPEASLVFPITIRSIENGDKIVPLGMKTKKKISDIMQDYKLSVFEKEEILLIENGSAEIIWLANYAVSDLCQINFAKNRIISIFMGF